MTTVIVFRILAVDSQIRHLIVLHSNFNLLLTVVVFNDFSQTALYLGLKRIGLNRRRVIAKAIPAANRV